MPENEETLHSRIKVSSWEDLWFTNMGSHKYSLWNICFQFVTALIEMGWTYQHWLFFSFTLLFFYVHHANSIQMSLQRLENIIAAK